MHNKIKIMIDQYGYKNFFIRVSKSFLRRIGFTYEKFFIFRINLDKKVMPKEPKIDIDVRELDSNNIDSVMNLGFSKSKLDLFKRRLDSNTYIALGAFHNEKLIYLCWLSLKFFESSVDMGDKIILEKDEALLLDAFTHPDYRSLGIHSYMNAIRLNKSIELNKNKAIVLVLAENTHAIKSQIKVGFEITGIIRYIKIFGKIYISKRDLSKYAIENI